MMTLKQAIEAAGHEADRMIEPVWAQTFAASLDASGFVIVPKEATDEMLSECETRWRERMAERPALQG